MNKGILFFLVLIISIFLTYFVVAGIVNINLINPTSDSIINGTYNFTLNISTNTTDYTNITFFQGSTILCNLSNLSPSHLEFNCTYDTTQFEDGTYIFNVTIYDNETNSSTGSTNVIVDNNAPLITLVEPVDNDKSTITNVTFTFLPSDVLLDSCILYGDWNSSGQKNQSSTPSNNSNNYFFHELNEGSYSWNISCNDTLGRTNVSSSYSFSLGVPSVTLGSPSNDTWNNTLLTDFSCSATDNSQLTKIELTIWNNAGVLQATNFTNTNGTTNSSTWYHLLSNNTVYFWACNATDNASQTSWTSNKTLTIDTTAPTFVYTLPVDDASYDYDESVTCNCSATDNLDPSPTCTLYSGTCSSSAGTRNITFKARDNAGNERFTTVTYSVDEESTSGGDTTESGGGGGGATTTSVSDVGAISDEHCWDTIASGAIAEFDVNNTRIGIRKITMIAESALSDPCLEAKQVISATAAGITLYTNSENVYKYFKITPTNIANTDLTSVLIEFSVSKTWLYNHKKETVALYRYYNGWNKLETEELSEDTDFVYFSAETPGFSSFVIIADKISAESSNLSESCGNAICEVNEDSENCCQDCGCEKDFECKDNECKEVSSGLFITGWLGQIGDRLHVEWLGHDWLFGWPIWSFIVIGIFATFITLVIIFRKKLHLSLPFQIDFSIHKKPDYGFK